MGVPPPIWDSVLGDTVSSLREEAKTAPWTNRFKKDLGTFLEYSEDLATIGRVQPHIGTALRDEEGESAWDTAYTDLQDSIISPDRDTGTIRPEDYPDFLLLRLTEGVKECMTARPSWVRAKALLALDKKVDYYRTKENWTALGVATDVNEFTEHTQRYIASVAEINGPPVTLVLQSPCGDEQQEEKTSINNTSLLSAALTHDIISRATAMPLSRELDYLRGTLGAIVDLAEIVHDSTRSLNEAYSFRAEDKDTSSATISSNRTICIKKADYEEMFTEFRDATTSRRNKVKG